MEKFNFRKVDFLPTGSAELVPIYLRFSAVGSAISMRGTLFFYFSDGVGYAYGSRIGIERLKKEMLAEPYAKLEAEFLTWKQTWDAYDEELFEMATKIPVDLQKTWERLDNISREIFVGSYKVEALDNFAEEIETFLLGALEKKNIDSTLLSEIISPANYMINQQAAQDLKRVTKNEISKEAYLRKYWFLGGTWAGGELFDAQMLEKNLQNVPIEIDFEKRRSLHTLAENSLRKEVLEVIEILRLLAVWREERKAQVQRFCLGYKKLVESIAEKIEVSHRVVEWSLREEFDQLVQKKEEIVKRRERSAFVFSEKWEDGILLNGDQTAEIFNEFALAEKTQEIKGTVACRGRVEGYGGPLCQHS